MKKCPQKKYFFRSQIKEVCEGRESSKPSTTRSGGVSCGGKPHTGSSPTQVKPVARLSDKGHVLNVTKVAPEWRRFS